MHNRSGVAIHEVVVLAHWAEYAHKEEPPREVVFTVALDPGESVDVGIGRLRPGTFTLEFVMEGAAHSEKGDWYHDQSEGDAEFSIGTSGFVFFASE